MRMSERYDDRPVAGQPTEKRFVHRNTTDDCERPATSLKRLRTRQGEELAFGAARRHERRPARAGQRRRQSGLDAAMLVPEVAGADDRAVAILDLEHRQ